MKTKQSPKSQYVSQAVTHPAWVSGDFFQVFADALTDLCLIYDKDLRILYLNRKAMEYSGVEAREEIIGQYLQGVSPTILETGIREDYLRVLETGEPLLRETTETVPVGTRHFSVRAFKIGENLAVIALDITKPKEKELENQKNLDQIQKYVEETIDLHLQVNTEGNITYANKVLGNILGLGVKDLPGMPFFELLHQDDQGKLLSEYQRWTDDKTTIARLENRLVGINGQIHSMFWTINIVYDADNNPLLMNCIGRDITELRQAEERAFLQADIIEQLHDAVVTTDTDLNIIEWNKEASSLFGYTKKEVLGTSVTRLLATKEGNFLHKRMKIPLRNSIDGIDTEIELVKKDNSQFIGHVRFSLLKDKNKTESGYIAAIIDISSQKQTLKELQLSEDRLRNAQRIAMLGHWEWNIQKGTLWLSDQIYNIFKLDSTRTDLPSNALFLMVHREDQSALEEKIMLCRDDGVKFDHQYRIIDDSGTGKIVHEQGELIRDAEGEALFMTGTIRDITAQKEVEEELRQYQTQLEEMVQERTQHIEKLNKELLEASRQAGMAEVATGVLHNVGNVLNSINVSVNITTRALHKLETQNISRVYQLLKDHKNNLGYFLDQTDKGQQLTEYLSQLSEFQDKLLRTLNEELKSMENHVNHVKHIVRMQQSHTHAKAIKEEVYLSEVFDQAITISGLKSDPLEVILKTEYDEHDQIEIEVHKLLQILVNLLSNARESVLSNDNKDKRIIVRTQCNEQYIQISIEDSGVGIDEPDQDRVFSMGFSTKADGHGFGLHTSANLAAELGGMINAKSKGIGKGACFTLRIKR